LCVSYAGRGPTEKSKGNKEAVEGSVQSIRINSIVGEKEKLKNLLGVHKGDCGKKAQILVREEKKRKRNRDCSGIGSSSYIPGKQGEGKKTLGRKNEMFDEKCRN